MGQKTHPVGLRIGIHRKWVSSWYGTIKEKNTFSQGVIKQSFLSQGVINSRGGHYRDGVEDFVESYLRRYPFTKSASARRLLLVDFRLFKGYAGYMYGFIIYTKLLVNRTKKKL